MRTLKARFFFLFTGLGIVAALGIGLVMYYRYLSDIRNAYKTTLEETVTLAKEQFPEMSDPAFMIREGVARSEAYWNLVSRLAVLVKVFDLSTMYFLQPTDGGGFRFLISSDATPEAFKNYEGEAVFQPYDDPPEELITAYKTKTVQLTRKPVTDEYGTYISAFLPAVNGDTVNGIIAADYDVSFVRELERRALLALLIPLIAIAFVSCFIALAVSSSLIRPIKGVMAELKTIACGDLTAEEDPNFHSAKEIEDMMIFLGQTRESIKELVTAIQDKAGTLSSVGSELSRMMEDSAAAIEEISGGAKNIKEKAGVQAGSVTETNAIMSEIISNIASLNTSIEEQADSVSRSSSAVEEMTANIASVTKSLMQNHQNIEQLADASGKGRDALQKVSANIKDIQKESEDLLEINKMIDEIANQTNLLSMHAAIEAAHAGEVGQGFAVVAGEIRKLAESSSSQAKIVADVLAKIKGSLDAMGGATETALNHFENIDTGVKTVAEQEANIRTAMEEQDSGSRDILETISRSNSITQNVRSSSEQMLSGSRKVAGEGKNLETITVDLNGNISTIASGMEKIGAASGRIREISRENGQSIEALIGEIGKFKIEA